MMLQPKNISHILAQALSNNEDGPMMISLLSNKGLPLATVTPSVSLFNRDDLRVYSLLAINSFQQQPSLSDSALDNWAVVEIDGNYKAMINRFYTMENPQNFLYVVEFYVKDFPDSKAKARLDSVTKSLEQGLQGYVPS